MRKSKKSKFRSVTINKKRYYFYTIKWLDITGDSGHATEEEMLKLQPSKMVTQAYIFKKDSKDKIEEEIKKIKLSIMEIGFNNTANIFSISDSSKTGGKLGWITKNALSKKIFEEIEKINNGDNTEIIDIGNNFLILKKEDTRIISAEIDKQKELNKLVQQETNNQLNRFSRIFFEKSKKNYVITDE